ncbi:MAG: class I tRNA ligase family protein, partial [Acidimicrobiia bacterium]|nr:class I tRNA ligase family protein [Acidimicrobiia bacterium]
MISLYNTAVGEVVPLQLRDPGKVSIYVCGPTVYGPPHIGHGRHTLVYDVLRRFLVWKGLEVTFVSNITDIDDKIIQRANDEQRDWRDIAVKCEQIWWKSMDLYNVQRPDHAPHATDYVTQMVDLISELVSAEKAYRTSDGVYLRVGQIPDYGLLAKQNLDDLVAGGGDRSVVGTEKEHPADFALWKFTKAGEPSWDSPWGAGRPGWHTECVVMSLDL